MSEGPPENEHGAVVGTFLAALDDFHDAACELWRVIVTEVRGLLRRVRR